jgi:hypothetical protein
VARPLRKRCIGLRLTWKELTPMLRNTIYDFKILHTNVIERMSCNKLWDDNRQWIVKELFTWELKLTMVYQHTQDTKVFRFRCGLRSEGSAHDATAAFMIASRMEHSDFLHAEFTAQLNHDL